MAVDDSLFTIALPAGRMADESLDFFAKAGIAQFDLRQKGRELSFVDTINKIQILLVRNKDVPTYVLQGAADAGITGRDVLIEDEFDLTVPFELNFGHCRLCVAAKKETAPTIMDQAYLRVATKYTRLATDYFFKKGINCEIIKLYGSIELAPLVGMSDCIVDLVSTGATLEANGLVEVEQIMHSSAVLVVARSTWALKTIRVRELLEKFKSTLY